MNGSRPQQVETSLPAVDEAVAPSNPSVAQLANEHPVVEIPFTMVIDGRAYNGRGVSLVGAQAAGLVTPQLAGTRRLVTLQFSFVGFNVNLQTDAVIDEASTDAGTISVRFLEPTGPHLPQLRYILNSFIGGELVGVDNIIAVGGEAAVPGAVRRPGAKQAHRGVGRWLADALRTALMLALGLVLVAFVGSKLYERFFVLPVGGLPIVSYDGTTLRAISSGQIDFVSTTAKKGEAAFAIRTLSGDVLTIQMPCDCQVVPGSAKVGDTVISGDPVMVVAATNAATVIKAGVSADTLRALAAGGLAEVRFPDGHTINAKLDADALRSTPLALDGAELADIRLVPDAPLDRALAGTPVSVAVHTQPWGLGGVTSKIAGFFSGLTGGAK